MTDIAPSTGPVTVPSASVSPASLVSELKNPSTYLTLASYVPTVWAIFFSSNKASESVALAVIHVAAIVAGPLATAVYAISHAMKASSHENRLSSVESALVGLYNNVSANDPTWLKTVEAEVPKLLALSRGATVLVPTPGPKGEAGPVGPSGPQGPEGRSVIVASAVTPPQSTS